MTCDQDNLLGGNGVSCGNAGECYYYCDAKRCTSDSTLDARNANNLYVIMQGSADECVKTATFLLPNNGNAYFSTEGEAYRPFREMTIQDGTNTGQIEITINSDYSDDGDAMKNMVISAANAESLKITLNAQAELEGGTITCPNYPPPSRYEGPLEAPCIIDMGTDGYFAGTTEIIAPNGFPKGVAFPSGVSTAASAYIDCDGSTSALTDLSSNADCYWTSDPTADPTSSPTTATPSSSPTTTAPSSSPTSGTTAFPSSSPVTVAPSSTPSTAFPTTSQPSDAPSKSPSKNPTSSPSENPSSSPSSEPSSTPTTHNPTTNSPTNDPTEQQPTRAPTGVTQSPTKRPTDPDIFAPGSPTPAPIDAEQGIGDDVATSSTLQPLDDSENAAASGTSSGIDPLIMALIIGSTGLICCFFICGMCGVWKYKKMKAEKDSQIIRIQSGMTQLCPTLYDSESYTQDRKHIDHIMYRANASPCTRCVRITITSKWR